MVSYLDRESLQDNDPGGFADHIRSRFKIEEKISAQPTKPFDESLRSPEKPILLLANEKNAFTFKSLLGLSA